MTGTDRATESHLFYQAGNRRPTVSRSEGIYLWDVSGKCYIDASSGPMVSNIGHSNPRVLAAMKRQMDATTFAYRTHFVNDAAESLASLTASLMPHGLDRIFFTSGGSETIESCLKLARQYALATGQPERWKVISLFPSYHGSTLGAVAITGMHQFVEPFGDMIRVMPKVPAATCYLDHDELTHEERGVRYAELLRDEILSQGPETVLGFIMEPVGGASTGALVAPDSWYRRVEEICREFGVLLIADEVMTGAGRTGRFLGSEHWDLRPDIVALAKGFGAGYAPLGAMAADRTIVDAVMANGGFAHGYTYSGNPLACSAGLAVLHELIDNDLIQNAAVQGTKLKAMLTSLMDRYPFIGDVRGKGLLLAFELVADRQTMEPLPPDLNAHTALVEEAYQRGLIIYSRRTRGGTIGDHFMVCPPLIVTGEQLDEIMNLLVESLDAFADAAGLSVKRS
ncbi:MAG: aspartate aminotransferase family protein [Acidimicrobiia bacterium]|nr:aspartate aminotransferase family protein [Acidimicrobiia bacterium]